MMKNILMMGSLPLARPWNGADKNLARFFVNHDPNHQFIVHTSLTEQWHAGVYPVRTTHVGEMPTAVQKLRSFVFLLQHAHKADMVHIVASFSKPSFFSTNLLRIWHRFYRGKLIHTLPSLGDSQLHSKDFIGDATVVVSDYSRKRLESLGVKNVFRTYPALSKDDIRPQLSPDYYREQYKLGTKAILYPAHYGENSGIKTMIQAFARLPKDLSDVILAFACRTHLGQDAEEEAQKVMDYADDLQVADRVRVINKVDDMPALMQACHITALVPSKLASKMDLPLVILESLLLGKPVIISDIPPIHEALLGDCGYAVPHDDVDALQCAIRALLIEDNYQRMAYNGVALVQKYCSPDAIVRQYQAIYDGV